MFWNGRLQNKNGILIQFKANFSAYVWKKLVSNIFFGGTNIAVEKVSLHKKTF